MSRPVFSFRPNLKNPEHEKAWRILMDVPTGRRNQYLVDVILEKEERETLRKLIQETVREELKSGDMERILLGGELRETQTANYFSNFSPVDCAVPSANA